MINKISFLLREQIDFYQFHPGIDETKKSNKSY